MAKARPVSSARQPSASRLQAKQSPVSRSTIKGGTLLKTDAVAKASPLKEQMVFIASLVMLCVGIVIFLIGTGIWIPKGSPSVTGMQFLEAKSYHPSMGYIYGQDEALDIQINGVKNLEQDPDGRVWVDLSLRLQAPGVSDPEFFAANLLGDGGKTVVYSPFGLSPHIRLPLGQVRPGTYNVTVEVLDRNSNLIVGTLIETITVK